MNKFTALYIVKYMTGLDIFFSKRMDMKFFENQSYNMKKLK